jgi:hypothetical protein
MASEYLLEAINTYIKPLLSFGSVFINENGVLVNQESGQELYFKNDNFQGLPDEVPHSMPIIPLSDSQYLYIKDTKGLEVFNPFMSIKHMELVVLQFKRGLIDFCVSDEKYNELSVDKLEELLQFYYTKMPGGSLVAGMSLVEDPENPQDIFTYMAADPLEAMWGLCITAYNAVDKRHDPLFYEPEKSWKKAMRLVNKWEEGRKLVAPRAKAEQQENFGFANMDLTGDGNYTIREYGNGYFVDENDMDSFMFSLFSPEELRPLGPEVEAQPFQRGNKPWTFPDFASDSVIFGKKKPKKSSGPRLHVPERVDYEIIKEEPIPPPGVQQENFPLAFPLPLPEAAPVSGEAIAGLALEPPQEEVKPASEMAVKPDAVEEKPAAPPPIKPKINWRTPPQQPYMPMGGMGMGYPGAQSPYGQPLMGGFNPPFQGGNPLIPSRLDDIDFVSNDRPDPFESYKKSPW